MIRPEERRDLNYVDMLAEIFQICAVDKEYKSFGSTKEYEAW